MSVGSCILETTTTKGNTLHVLQWIAVEAEDEDTATQKVDTLLEQELNPGFSWFDWYIVGGGRWNVSEDEKDSFMAGYNTKTNIVISYDKDPNAFYAKIQECLTARVEDYEKYLAEVKESGVIAKLDNYGGVMSYDYAFYALNALLRYQTGQWWHDTCFYDGVHDSTNATHILAKISNNEGKNLYLVPVDFHF